MAPTERPVSAGLRGHDFARSVSERGKLSVEITCSHYVRTRAQCTLSR